jgi:glucokinase
MDYAIGIDLGGTNIKVLSVGESGDAIECSTRATDDDLGEWRERVRDEIDAHQKKRGAPARWIGVAAPGLAAGDGRSVACMPGRLTGLEGLDWTTFLNAPRIVTVLNDAHAALLGEVWRGAAAGCRNCFMLTLGTGVGGAILADGKVLKGHLGRAGHLGHVSLNPDGAPDIVSTPGSLEDAIGNATLAARSLGRFGTTEALLSAYNRGDAGAGAAWLKSVKSLAAAIVSLINVLDPECVIIGGGICSAGPALFDPLQRFLDQFEWRPAGVGVPVVPAKLGGLAGAMGAAYNAMMAGKA